MNEMRYKHLAGDEGYLISLLPQEILDEIKPLVDKIQNNFSNAIVYNANLAGQIDQEYELNLTPNITQYIKNSIDEYCKLNPIYLKQKQQIFKDPPILTYEGGAWINFQKKYEYNPTHTHGGVFSYVIWYQIPFYRENEVNYGAGKYKSKNQYNHNGEFEFVYYDGVKITYEALGIDKTMEGYMAIFPSSLSHQVYPFYTSDEYRITISGNILLSNI